MPQSRLRHGYSCLAISAATFGVSKETSNRLSSLSIGSARTEGGRSPTEVADDVVGTPARSSTAIAAAATARAVAALALAAAAARPEIVCAPNADPSLLLREVTSLRSTRTHSALSHGKRLSGERQLHPYTSYPAGGGRVSRGNPTLDAVPRRCYHARTMSDSLRMAAHRPAHEGTCVLVLIVTAWPVGPPVG